MPRTEQQKVE